jgi:hypothetical protein
VAREHERTALADAAADAGHQRNFAAETIR